MKQRLFSILAGLLLAMTATSMWADEFIKDVMVIGGSKTEVNNLKTTLSAQGWTVINQDLNAKASGDYIYLLYKSESNSDDVNYGYITDFYISNERGVAPDTRTVNGRTYYLVPYDGSDYFKDVERKGDLNSNAGGDYIHLYYTRDIFADKRAVKGITFNSTKSGAVGVNGGTTGYDLNSGAGGDYIYMHLTTGILHAYAVNLDFGTNVSTEYPLSTKKYNYSMSQQIYTAEEIGTDGTISSIAFRYASAEPFSMEGVQVFMKHTDKGQFDSKTDVVPVGASDKVFEGTFSATGKGWATITLDTPFEYDGNSNLLICCYDPTYGRLGEDCMFSFHWANEPRHLHVASDYDLPSLDGEGIDNFWELFITKQMNDIQFVIIPGDFPHPAKLTVSSCNENEATLTWEAPLANHTIAGYAYQYKKVSDANWSDEVRVNSDTYSATLSGLSSSTDYIFRVKTIYFNCESSYSICRFTSAIPLPYEYGFENGMERWVWLDIIWGYTGIKAEATHNGQNGFYFFSGQTDGPQYLISPRIPDTSAWTLSFYYRDKRPDSGFWETFQVGYSTTTGAISDFIWSDDLYATNIPWTLYEQTFPAGTKYIAIKYKSTLTGGLYLDDFSFEEYSQYARPTDLTVSDLTDTSVNLAWTAPDVPVTGYIYQYKNLNENSWSAESSVNTTTITLNGLSANTNYKFRVKALYAGGKASNYVSIDFITEGPTVSLPYSEGFENGMGGWRIVDGYITTGLYSKDKNNIYEGNYSFEFNFDEQSNARQYLISPQFDGSKAMIVSFHHKNYSEGTYILPVTFQVGYSTKTKDLDDFTWVDQDFSYSGEWEEHLSYFPVGTKYVAVKKVAGLWFYVDDFRFTEATPLAIPQQLAASNVTALSADISWTGNTDSYQVRYRTELLFWEDFDNGFDQWKVVNQGGNAKTDWHVAYNEEQDYHYAMSGTYDIENNTGYAVDNWLISPQVTLDGFLRFWAAQNKDFPVYYEVLVSTTTDDINEFVKVAAPDPPVNDNEWEIVTVDLSSYQGQKGYIAFRLKDENKDWLSIVDVSICLDDNTWKYVNVIGEIGEVTGLLPLTAYEYQVRAQRYKYYTDWSEKATFTTNRLVPLYDDKDNNLYINAMADVMAAQSNANFDVMLVRRELYRGGTWNTLCLPFGVSDFNGTPLEGATVKMLESTYFGNGTLVLNFTDATSIDAGKPYFLKWDLPYPDLIIRSAADWDAFTQDVNNGTESYEGKFVQLGTDISVSTMAGTADHPFCGTFDGAGYTLNLSINDSGAEYAAPFRYINGAKIRNLKVTGSVNGGQYCAGIVGAALGGTNSIRDCWMAASVTGQSNIGGILGHGTISATTISNCFLDGSLNAKYIGIFYGGGSDGGIHAIENCWAWGTYASYIGGGTDLVLTDGGTVNITNCRQNLSRNSQGTYYILVVTEGSFDVNFVYFLGGQWTLDDNERLTLKHITDIANITSPVFRRVRVSNIITPVETDHVNFIGITSPTALDANDSSLLFLNTDNMLYHPYANKTLNACRAYFQLKDSSLEVWDFVLNFDGEDPVNLKDIREFKDIKDSAWFDLSGRRLSGKPSQQGIYVNSGKKVVIK